MSELNRLLSDLSSQKNEENNVTVVTIPNAWGFRLARVALALFGTLAGASSLAWAISATDFTQLSRNLSSIDPIAFISTHNISISPKMDALPVETRAVVAQQNINSSSVEQAISLAKMGSHAEIEVNKEELLAQNVMVKKVEESILPASLHVESVDLTSEQLAVIAYENAQKKASEGDMQKAIAYLHDAVQYNPRHISAVNQLSGLLFGRNQIRDAENVLRKGIKINPTSSTLRLTLARIYQQTQREESALIVLTAADLTFDDDPVRLVSMRAALAQKFGQNDLAKKSYQWLTKNEPTDGRWWLGLGVVAEKENDYKEADRAYKEAVNTGGLSNKAVEFARQRIVYLEGVAQGKTAIVENDLTHVVQEPTQKEVAYGS